MAIRGNSITIQYVAWDTSNNIGKTGDSANHTLRRVKDGTSAAPTNSPSEVDATNAKGVYSLVLTASEMTCDCITVCGVSSTANVVIIPLTITTEHGVLPNVVQGNAGAVLTSGTGTAQLNVTSGVADANVKQALGNAVTTATNGILDVNTKNINNVAAATDGNNYLKVDVEDIAGSAVSTTTAQVGVNVVKYNNQTAATDANNYPKVNVTDWNGTAVGALPANFSSLLISAGGHISNVDTLTTYTGDTPQTGDCYARLGAPAGASIAADIAEVEGETDSLLADLPANFSALAITGAGAVAVDGTSAMAESYTKGAFTLAQALYEIAQTLGQFSISGTTLTVQKRDGSTTAATFTLNDASNPTSRTRST